MSFNINLTVLMKMGRNYTFAKVILQVAHDQCPSKGLKDLPLMELGL